MMHLSDDMHPLNNASGEGWWWTPTENPISGENQQNLIFQASFVHQTCLKSKNLRDCQMCCLPQVSPDSQVNPWLNCCNETQLCSGQYNTVTETIVSPGGRVELSHQMYDMDALVHQNTTETLTTLTDIRMGVRFMVTREGDCSYTILV